MYRGRGGFPRHHGAPGRGSYRPPMQVPPAQQQAPKQPPAPLNEAPRKEIPFEFSYCGDDQGVLHWIGSSKGMKDWVNPCTAGLVKVSMSSLEHGRPHMLVDKTFDAQVCCTNNEPNSWMAVELQQIEVCPTVYSFAHRAGNTEALVRSWYFLASNDNINWECLDERNNDETMTATDLWSAYAITPTTKYYRYFRVMLQPSGNTSGTDALVMCCLEIYGKAHDLSPQPTESSPPPAMLTQMQPYPQARTGRGGKPNHALQTLPPLTSPYPPTQTNFTYTKPGDGRGVLAFLGTRRGTMPWSNPQDIGEVLVCASSVKQGSISSVADYAFRGQVFFTDNKPKSWVSVDLKSVSCCPTHYTFSHRGGMSDYFARSWVIQGSTDGINFEPIWMHNNDQELNERAHTGVWSLRCSKFYRVFRISLQPGGNSKRTHALVVTCFEVYGSIKPAY
eukprot:Sspe_Gene.71852::Locus_42688_Transcript_1_1_Confidence_1.000_Length_1521::g.71852::m.71852